MLFFNYGLETGTIWKTKAFHEPILCATSRGAHITGPRNQRIVSVGLAVLPQSKN